MELSYDIVIVMFIVHSAYCISDSTIGTQFVDHGDVHYAVQPAEWHLWSLPQWCSIYRPSGHLPRTVPFETTSHTHHMGDSFFLSVLKEQRQQDPTQTTNCNQREQKVSSNVSKVMYILLTHCWWSMNQPLILWWRGIIQ